ncbi:hypothetical protein ZWY2020_059522 [Hordeum vulgare]|nr:hypothetical protein ZWY2020_059522 [Hordeum vulgare]
MRRRPPARRATGRHRPTSASRRPRPSLSSRARNSSPRPSGRRAPAGAVAPRKSRDEQGRWVCKEEGCHQQFATHQGLGGHMAAHKMRKNNEAAAALVAAGLHPCLANAKPAATPVQALPQGGQLGRAARLAHEDALRRPRESSHHGSSADWHYHAGIGGRARAGTRAGHVEIFGVNFVVAAPAASGEEVSSAVRSSETDQSSAASTNIQE